ncbi:MAG: N-acetylmuramoyl-L-alanine amidase [Eubacteriales bacterium]|nr:N-acetylmuramoyl-L-alanine amidase [Eubacteriales bacterium]
MNRIIRLCIVLIVVAVAVSSFLLIRNSLAEASETTKPTGSNISGVLSSYSATPADMSAGSYPDTTAGAATSIASSTLLITPSLYISAAAASETTQVSVSASASGPASASASGPDSAQGTPLSGDSPSDFIIAVDAGHGGIDIGAHSAMLGSMIKEKDITIAIAVILKDLLVSNGYQVLMIRKDDENIDRIDRIEFANEKNASLYVSIHCDWFSDSSVNGTTTYYSGLNTNDLGKLTHEIFAECIHSALMSRISFNDRGFRQMNDFAVLRRARMPSVLIELGYLSNYSDISRLADPNVMESMAHGIFEGIINALDYF